MISESFQNVDWFRIFSLPTQKWKLFHFFHSLKKRADQNLVWQWAPAFSFCLIPVGYSNLGHYSASKSRCLLWWEGVESPGKMFWQVFSYLCHSWPETFKTPSAWLLSANLVLTVPLVSTFCWSASKYTLHEEVTGGLWKNLFRETVPKIRFLEIPWISLVKDVLKVEVKFSLTALKVGKGSHTGLLEITYQQLRCKA